MSAEPLLTDPDRQTIAMSKALAADTVEKTGSGHPGTPISLAGVAWLLYQREMVHDPADPGWSRRDRLVLSIGHASLVQYIQLFLAGYDIDLEGFTAFRPLADLPGHPEFGEVPGVETTASPLGAGFANAVGLAIAARREHRLLDTGTPLGKSVFDHFVYTVLGDGCMQEGMSSEAASLAGTQQLGNLIAIYDDNDISIEGSTDIAFTRDVSARFEAYGWQVLNVDWRTSPGGYAENLEELHKAIIAARAESARPSLIRLYTIIAWPSPTKQGQESSHGSKLGTKEVVGLKRALGLDPEQSFALPEDVVSHSRKQAADNARVAQTDWDARFASWQQASPAGAALLERLEAHHLPEGLEEALPVWEAGEPLAIRVASGKVLSALAGVIPELWGGLADLAGSNNTTMAEGPSFLPADLAQSKGDGPFGHTLHFGVREHAMDLILNGIALDGLTRPYGGTFMVFSDYMRPAVRLAALMGIGLVFVWLHDSIGVGEDGPTYQLVEHLVALHVIPGLAVVRPGDANETAAAWIEILCRHSESAGIAPSCQNLTANAPATAAAEGVRRGAYVLARATDTDEHQMAPEAVLIATGSEVGAAAAAREIPRGEDTPARVVSAPCLEWFAQQDAAYREQVLLAGTARVAIEAGIALGWRETVGDAGEIVSIDHYGSSAPGIVLFEEYGFIGNNVAKRTRRALVRTRG